MNVLGVSELGMVVDPEVPEISEVIEGIPKSPSSLEDEVYLYTTEFLMRQDLRNVTAGFTHVVHDR